MEALSSRVGLGCGRLSGGAAESNSRRVLSVALDYGIRYFDTAPSYGGGASERILGQALRGLRSDVQLCSKVGLPRSLPNAKAEWRTLIISGIRMAMPEAAISRLSMMRRAKGRGVSKPSNRGNFDPAQVRASVTESLEQLGTDHLDGLLLHEPRESDPNPELADMLREFVRIGAVRRLGVGTGSGYESLPGFGDIAQFEIGPSVFASDEARVLIGHGLLRGLSPVIFAKCAEEVGLLQSHPSLRRYLSDSMGSSALLLNSVVLGMPLKRILISTTSPKRLGRFMSVANNICDEIASDARGADDGLFTQLVNQYFARLRQAS